MGISSDSVRAVEAKALNKLRQPRMNYRLKDYMRGMRELGDVVMATDDDHHDKHHHAPRTINNNGNGDAEEGNGDNRRPTPESIWSF